VTFFSGSGIGSGAGKTASTDNPGRRGVARMIGLGFPERYAERNAEKMGEAEGGTGKSPPEISRVMLG